MPQFSRSIRSKTPQWNPAFAGSRIQQRSALWGWRSPTAAVVLALFTQVALVQLWIDGQEVMQLSGVQPHHLLVCDALGLDHAWYEAPSAHKTDPFSQAP